MKKFKLLLVFILLSVYLYPSSSYTGMTGGIDFPSAYLLINKNYTISGTFSSLNKDIVGDFVIETALIPQVEAGLKVTTLNGNFDQSFLQANVKFQVVPEGKGNPAIAIGFSEFDAYSVQSNQEKELKRDSSEAYAFLVMSKQIRLNDLNFDTSVGITYSQPESGGVADIFGIIEMPLFEKIRFLTEVYSYEKVEKKSASVNLGAEFITKDNFRTKVFWRERNDSFGVSINYIGLFAGN